MPKRSQDSESHLYGQLKELVGGPMARMRAGITDIGEIFVGTVKDVSGAGDGPSLIHQTFRDVWVHVVDLLTGQPVLARLMAPAGILWRLPKEGDGAYVVRGRKADGPGGPLAMVDGGDGATDNVVPQWLDSSNAGIYGDETQHVESAKGDVKVDASTSGKKVLLQGGGKGVARLDDTVNCGWLYFLPNVPPGGAASLVYLPPDTTPTPTPLLYPAPGVLLPLRGKIDSASNKSETG